MKHYKIPLTKKFTKPVVLIFGIIVSLICLLVTQTKAQSVLSVLVTKGDVSVKSSSSWKPLLTGSALQAKDEIKLAANSYVGLLHPESGRPVEINHPGSFSVQELVANMKDEGSLINKYTSFILSRDNDVANRGSATGAVHRGNAIRLFLPANHLSSFYDPSIIVTWEAAERNITYDVSLTSLLDDQLMTFHTKDTALTINMLDPYLAGHNAVMVEVNPVGSRQKIKSESFLLKRVSPTKRALLDKEFEQIVSNFADVNSAFSHYMITGFYEKNGQLVDALTAFQRAINKDPSNHYYKKKFQEFINRNGLGN